MMKYSEWKLLNESMALGPTNLGLSQPRSLGMMGPQLGEAELDVEEPDLEDEDLEDEDEEEGDADFPPEDSEEEMGVPEDDGFEDDLSAIEPSLLGDELGGDAEMGDELGGDLGDELGGDAEMGDLGGDLGDELGGDAEMGDELGGDELGMGEPCPECNPEGEMEEGDPHCQTCDGAGHLEDMEGETDMIDADVEDSSDNMDDIVSDFMKKMTAYQKKYMKSDSGHKSNGGRKFMGKNCFSDFKKSKEDENDKDDSDKEVKVTSKSDDSDEKDNKKGKKPPKKPFVKSDKKSNKEKEDEDNDDDVKYMCGKTKCESVVGTSMETDDDFFSCLTNQTKGEVREKFDSGMSFEDALFQPVDPNLEPSQRDTPEAGEVGFSPQGRIGSMGGGYTQNDIGDIPTLGDNQ